MTTNLPHSLSGHSTRLGIFKQLTFDAKLVKSTQRVEKMQTMNQEEAERYTQGLKELAEGGWDEAAIKCAFILLNGEIPPHNNYEKICSVPRDEKEGIRLLKITVARRSAAGQFSLGACYDSGKGVYRDEDEARRLYRLAADQGYQPAIDAIKSMPQESSGLTSLSQPMPQNTAPPPQNYQSMIAMLNQWRQEQESDSLQYYQTARATLSQLPHEQKSTSLQSYQSATAALNQWRQERENAYQSAIAAIRQWDQESFQEDNELPSQPPTPQPKR